MSVEYSYLNRHYCFGCQNTRMGLNPSWLPKLSREMKPYKGECLVSVIFRIFNMFPQPIWAVGTVPLLPVNIVQTPPTEVSLPSLLFQSLQKISCHRCHNPGEEDDFLINKQFLILRGKEMSRMKGYTK